MTSSGKGYKVHPPGIGNSIHKGMGCERAWLVPKAPGTFQSLG